MTRKLSGSMKYRSHAIAHCSGFEFPFDMLRYDHCYPSDSESAVQMGRSPGDIEPGETYQIRLTQLHEYKSPNWTIGRWASFGVRLEPVND
jgi:hypothetical protein